jgi:hypothetical protein
MPHPKNMQKLSGDVHPPELDERAGTELDDIAMDARADVDADTFRPRANTPSTMSRFRTSSLQGYGDAARDQVRAKPMQALGAAFALGFVLAAVFR